MNFESTAMRSIASNNVELPNFFRLDEVYYLINIESTTRGAQDGSAFMMNIFDAFGSKENGRCLDRSNQSLDTEGVKKVISGIVKRKQAYLGIVKPFESSDNTVHISFDTIQMIECSRNLTYYIVQTRT